MPDSASSEINPLDRLAEEFVERHRRGEQPSVAEYTSKHPELAKEIRDLFPALVMMEDVRPHKGDATGAFSSVTDADYCEGKKLERLGDYRILREVGRGGMGIVYEAEQESLGRHVALKVLPAHALLDPQRLRRFNREAKAAARLHHTNIVPVYGVGESDGLHYYVMQFIQGLGLDQVLAELRKLRRAKTSLGSAAPPESRLLRAGDVSAVDVARSLLTGRFKETAPADAPEDADDAAPPTLSEPPAPSRRPDSSSTIHLPGQTEHSTLSETGRQYWQSVARIGVQVADALAYANAQGTLHRDIKPSNLLLDTQGTVWVADFGLAKASDSEDLTHAGDIVGTIRYMAPERFRGQGDVRSDIYSLGLTLYELLALRPAFEESDRNNLISIVAHETPPSPRKLNPDVPRDLETIVLKAIARDPDHRYATAPEMAADLRRFLEDKPIRARRVSVIERGWRWCRRNPALAGLTTAIVLLLVVAAAGSAVAAYRFSLLADAQTKARADADAAKKEAEDRADEIRLGLDRLNRANMLIESGGLHANDGHWEEALADYSQAVELRPDVALVWMTRGQFHMQFFCWEEAAADLARGFERQPPVDPNLWYSHACLRLYAGDEAGYRQICARMLDKFGQTTDLTTSHLLARACILGPNALDDYSRIQHLMEKVVADFPQPNMYHAMLVAIHYRAGQPEQALRLLDSFSQKANYTWYEASLKPLLAMVYHRLGQEDKAKKWLDETNQGLDDLKTNLASQPLDASPTTYLVGYDLPTILLRREAMQALGDTAAEHAMDWAIRSRGHAALTQWTPAGVDIERALALRPDDFRIRLERGRLLAGQSRWDEALPDFDEILRKQPDEVAVWYERGRVYAQRGQWDKAAADFDRALELSESTGVPIVAVAPGASDMMNPYAVNTMAADLLKWEKVFLELTRRRPQDAQLWAERARALNQNGKAADAVAAITKAIELRPDDPQLLYERGYWYGQESHWEQAAADFARALDLVPDFGAQAGLGASIYSVLSIWEKVLDKTLALRPKDGELHAVRARMHMGKSERDKASAEFAEALKLRPDDAELRLERGRFLAQLGRWFGAAADFAEVIDKRPFNDDWVQHACLRLLAGDSEGYRKLCGSLRERYGKERNPLVVYPAGRICALAPGGIADPAQAVLWEEQALVTDPKNLFYMQALALALYRAGQFDQAEKRCRESMKVNPNWTGHPQNWLVLAMTCHQQKKPDEARQWLDKATEWLAKANEKRPKEEAGFQPPEMLPSDWLEYQVLRREAEKLLNEKGPKPEK
jgi:serine/threonine protein kinase/Flp pilus assembly protein TadD